MQFQWFYNSYAHGFDPEIKWNDRSPHLLFFYEIQKYISRKICRISKETDRAYLTVL